MVVKVGDKVYVNTFEAFECTEVREGTEYDLIDADFSLKMAVEQWQYPVANTRENNGADLNHILNTLDPMIDGRISDNAAGDQLRATLWAPGIKRVAQRISQQVAPQHQQEYCHPRREHQMGMGTEVGPSIV